MSFCHLSRNTCESTHGRIGEHLGCVRHCWAEMLRCWEQFRCYRKIFRACKTALELEVFIDVQKTTTNSVFLPQFYTRSSSKRLVPTHCNRPHLQLRAVANLTPLTISARTVRHEATRCEQTL